MDSLMNSDLLISSSTIVSIRFLYCCSVILIVIDFLLLFFIPSIVSSLVIPGVSSIFFYLVFSSNSRRVSLLKIWRCDSPPPYPMFKEVDTPKVSSVSTRSRDVSERHGLSRLKRTHFPWSWTFRFCASPCSVNSVPW